MFFSIFVIPILLVTLINLANLLPPESQPPPQSITLGLGHNNDRSGSGSGSGAGNGGSGSGPGANGRNGAFSDRAGSAMSWLPSVIWSVTALVQLYSALAA